MSSTDSALARAKPLASSAAVTGKGAAASAAWMARVRSACSFGHGCLPAGFFVPSSALPLLPRSLSPVLPLFLLRQRQRPLHVAALRRLKLRPQPANQAAGFLSGPLGVEGHQPGQDFFVAERRGPAVGFEHGGVEIVVD